MRAFRRYLTERQPEPGRRRWLFVPYDQLSSQIGPLAREDAGELGIIIIENPWKAARRPYHKQKLALILANLRHFALEQAARGVAVRHVVARGPYREVLSELAGKLGPIRVMEPAERELRLDLAPLVEKGALELLPHEGWLTTHEQFTTSQKGGAPWRMDAFYRHVRRETGILMQNGKPEGGKYSFDPENRKAWPGEPPAPAPPTFAVDEIKQEIGELIERHFAHHPGTLDLDHLPATNQDANALWQWAQQHCLPHFGPYEDAMSVHTSGLFHTRLSPLLNIHRLLPKTIIDDTLQLDLPLQSKEGFIRQIIGWREFIRHIHLATDGFRNLSGQSPEIAEAPGDGGYAAWSGKPWPVPATPGDLDGGAAPALPGKKTPLPPAYWGRESGLFCLDHVIAEVWREGYSHHITRLMVLANIATLLDISPRELTDWFWVAYIDAFDWVVEPNVLGMGTYAAGDVMSTKPYISGAAYINRMSDFCSHCSFDPKNNCPITRLYWAYLARHREILGDNPRLRMPYVSLQKRAGEQKKRDQQAFRLVRDTLARGDKLDPDALSDK